MDTVVFGTFTIFDILCTACVIIILLAAVSFIRKAFKKKAVDKYAQPVKCTGCDWQGQVSTIAGKCPQCNTPLGERRADG